MCSAAEHKAVDALLLDSPQTLERTLILSVSQLQQWLTNAWNNCNNAAGSPRKALAYLCHFSHALPLNKEQVPTSCCPSILELNTFFKKPPSRQEHSGEKYSQVFWQIHRPNDPLWLICEELNIVQPACFSLWDHEHLLAHNYIVIHCYLAEETSDDS